MILPPISTGPVPTHSDSKIDFRNIVLSPAQAVENLERVLGRTIDVSRVNLRQIRDTVVYEVHLRGGGAHLLNATSGQLFTIDRESAARYVLDMYPTEGRVVKSAPVEKYDYDYQWGALPAYRIVLDSDPSVDFFVTLNDGVVRRSDRWNRALGALASLHTLEPLKLFTRREEIRRGLMLAAGLLGLAATVTGYCLALRRSPLSK